jgi:hypothetical protein
MILRPGAATLHGSGDRWDLTGDPNLVIATVPHLLAGYATAEHLTACTHLTDMESAHLAAGLSPSPGPHPSVRVLITDHWPDEPFYIDAPGRGALLSGRRDDLVDECVQELL